MRGEKARESRKEQVYMQHLKTGWAVLAAAPLVLLAAASVAQDAGSGTTRQIQMVPAKAYLSKTLDAKKAKQGDPVTAKLLESIKIPDARELPSSTVLVGHIDQVQASDKKSDSSIQVTFDKAQLKDGTQIPVKATVMQISPPNNGAPFQQEGAQTAAPSMPSGGGGGAHGGSPTSGGGSPGMMSSPDQGQQDALNGVALKSDIHDSNSGTFMAKGKNVHLSEGTQMQFAVAILPPNAAVQ
jgi:hypothetical protein